MQTPEMNEPRQVAGETWQLGSWLPVPGLGLLPCNAFVIRARQPVLIDTGVASLREPFLAALGTVVDPAELRWIYLTHLDADHVGNLQPVLEAAPRARVVTTYLGMGKMGMLGLPQERVFLLNPGQALDVGDRRLCAMLPPSFDAPETTGVFDELTRALFCADSFGAVQPEVAQDAAAVDPETLRAGMRLWTSVDAPWLQMADRGRLREALEHVRDLHPTVVLGSHLQPARDMTGRLLQWLAEAAETSRFVGPDQAALEAMMTGMRAEAA